MCPTVQYSVACRTTNEKNKEKNYHNCYLLARWLHFSGAHKWACHIVDAGFLELDLPLQTRMCITVNPMYELGDFVLSYDNTKDEDMSCAQQSSHAKDMIRRRGWTGNTKK